MPIESVDIYVKDDTVAQNPVAGVIVRVFDATGTTFITQATSNSSGIAGFSLNAPASYQLRFFKEQFSIPQPQLISALEAPVAPQTNNFNAVGHVYTPPEAVHPRLCRCSGFFRRPDNSPAVGHDIHIIAKFDPILFEDKAMLTERLLLRTDERGYAQIDLVRFGQYDVTVEGFEDCLRTISIPDAPSVNLPDLLFAVVESITFDPVGPWAIGVGSLNDFTVVPTVRTSDGRILDGSAIEHVRWCSSNPDVLAVLPTPTTVVLRGLSPGVAELRAERLDKSIIRIPDTAIAGVPVEVTVA